MAAKLFKNADSDNGPQYYFFCPGCECDHGIWTNKKVEPCWDFNGSIEKPTFKPSIRVRIAENKVCHSIITDGKISFCNDSTHKLSGQVVELPDYL